MGENVCCQAISRSLLGRHRREKNLIEAYKWIYLANNDFIMSGRFAGAPQETIKKFEQGMTKAQIVEGKRRAKNSQTSEKIGLRAI